jgi:hypothetical protein
MDYTQEYITWRFRTLTPSFLAPSIQETKVPSRVHTVTAFADRFVRLALDPEHKALEGRYVFLNELKKENRDPVELRDQVLRSLVAGRDTTSGFAELDAVATCTTSERICEIAHRNHR